MSGVVRMHPVRRRARRRVCGLLVCHLTMMFRDPELDSRT
jgi:hypothetical protein